jgi:hypothetical protein
LFYFLVAVADPRRTNDEEEEFHSFFPYKLHRLLRLVEQQGLTHIVSWLPCGAAFKVHDIKSFEECVLPKMGGRLSYYKSFLRQLNMYTFKRSKAGAYNHPYFRRCHADLCRGVLRGEKMYATNTTASPSAKEKIKVLEITQRGAGNRNTASSASNRAVSLDNIASSPPQFYYTGQETPHLITEAAPTTTGPQKLLVRSTTMSSDEQNSSNLAPMRDLVRISSSPSPSPSVMMVYCSGAPTTYSRRKSSLEGCFSVEGDNRVPKAGATTSSTAEAFDILDEIIATFGGSVHHQEACSF